jgi:hypothetical protein
VIEYQLNAVRRRVQGALFSKAFGRAPLESEQDFFFHLCRTAVGHGFSKADPINERKGGGK